MPRWLNLPIDGHATWPTEEWTVNFDGCNILLKPAAKGTIPSVHVDLSHCTKDNAITAINRFLSVLSWCDRTPMRIMWERGGFSGSADPVPFDRTTTITIGSCIYNYPFYRVVETDEKVLLALALYREALTVISVPYQFLGFFKILNIKWKDKYINRNNELIDGIRGLIPHLKDDMAITRISELSSTTKDIPKYLYRSGRCAVAHAYSKPLVDPDKRDDTDRLGKDLPVIKALAELIISDMGVSHSITG